MKQLNKFWPIAVTIIGGLFQFIDLLLPDSLITNKEVQSTISHLFWIGNVFWYLGLPIAVIYLTIKVQDLQKTLLETQSTLQNKIDGNDKWLVDQVKWLTNEVGQCAKVFQPGK